MRQINLLPEPLQQAQNKNKIVNLLMITLGPTALGVIVIHFFMVVLVAHLEKKVNHPAVNVDIIEFMTLRQEIQNKSVDVQKYIDEHGAVISSYMDNYLCEDILRVIGNVSYHKVWFTRFDLNNKDKTCQIQGKSFNTRLVSEFMLGIKKMSFFNNVTLISMEKGQDEKVDFKIVCVLK